MIYISSTKEGYNAKQNLQSALINLGHFSIELGATDSTTQLRYPSVVYDSCNLINREKDSLIIISSDPMGACIVANKVHGIRSSVVYNQLDARTSKTKYNTNVICIPSSLDDESIKDIVTTWLVNQFQIEQEFDNYSLINTIHLRR